MRYSLLLTLLLSSLIHATTWTGTGFFINSDGYFITARHCTEGVKNFIVHYGNQVIPAHVIAVDRQHDIAIMKADVTGTNYYGLSTAYNVGDTVQMYGYPLPQQFGSNLKEQDGTYEGKFRNQVLDQFKLESYEGNSGSPVIDGNEVIGVLTEGIDDAEHNYQGSSISFTETSQSIINLLEANHISFGANSTFNKEDAVILLEGSSE